MAQLEEEEDEEEAGMMLFMHEYEHREVLKCFRRFVVFVKPAGFFMDMAD